MINKLYDTNLKLSPLNLSESILLNKVTYVKRLDNIYFDMKHDTNEDINAWFNFILDMADEQLFVAIGRIPSIDNRFIVLLLFGTLGEHIRLFQPHVSKFNLYGWFAGSRH